MESLALFRSRRPLIEGPSAPKLLSPPMSSKSAIHDLVMGTQFMSQKEIGEEDLGQGEDNAYGITMQDDLNESGRVSVISYFCKAFWCLRSKYSFRFLAD
jgi:hypothetical protein